MAPKKTILHTMFMFIIVLSACNGASPQDEIYEHLEEAVQLESNFELQQDEITALEKQEQEIYSQIVDLDMSDFDDIKDLADEAIEIIEQRVENLKIEQESLSDAKEEFENIKPLINDLKEENVRNKATEMYEVMMDRYKAYDNLHEAYLRSLEEEEELYTLIKDEDTSEDDLKDQIATINNTYQEVLDGNEEFNTHTITYNELKKDFYELANINVTYDED